MSFVLQSPILNVDMPSSWTLNVTLLNAITFFRYVYVHSVSVPYRLC